MESKTCGKTVVGHIPGMYEGIKESRTPADETPTPHGKEVEATPSTYIDLAVSKVDAIAALWERCVSFEAPREGAE